jgi:hypothetical protein
LKASSIRPGGHCGHGVDQVPGKSAGEDGNVAQA